METSLEIHVNYVPVIRLILLPGCMAIVYGEESRFSSSDTDVAGTGNYEYLCRTVHSA